MNSCNNGIYIGRLTKEPVFFENKDRSCIVILTVAAKRNFASGPNKEYLSDFITFKAYVPPRHNGVYQYLSVGDLVGISYSLRSSTAEKDGETKYYQDCFIESIDILEGKTKREERRAAREAK